MLSNTRRLKGMVVACFVLIPSAGVVIFDIFFHFGSCFGQASLTLGARKTVDTIPVASVKFTKLPLQKKRG